MASKGELVAVALDVITRDGGVLRRRVSSGDAEAINRGAIASPNLFSSLAPREQSILVRVFEKLCCQAEAERSMMARPKTK